MNFLIDGHYLNFFEPKIMGILNVTPDSFFDGGNYYNNLDKAVDYVADMISCGATFIDVGGESTRPNSDVISDEEELERVIPVVDAISKRFNVYISVNTSKALVMRESATYGAHLINDIRSLSENRTIEAIVSSKLSICVMHMKGTPKTMQNNPVYYDVVSEVNNYFGQLLKRFELFGIDRNRILLDPGFGFGKTLKHNYQLLAGLSRLNHFNIPLLIGTSRKSMFNFNDTSLYVRYPSTQRLIGSVSSAVIAVLQGAKIIRTHDVQETFEALTVVNMTMQNKGNIFYEV